MSIESHLSSLIYSISDMKNLLFQNLNILTPNQQKKLKEKSELLSEKEKRKRKGEDDGLPSHIMYDYSLLSATGGGCTGHLIPHLLPGHMGNHLRIPSCNSRSPVPVLCERMHNYRCLLSSLR